MKPIFELHPDYGTLYTIEQFRENVKSNCITDYDGHGYLSNGKEKAKNFVVYPSQFKKGKVHLGLLWELGKTGEIPKWATHIIWFNK